MSKIRIIAEAGVNHNGDIELAKKLIDAASDAGADIVKFQTFVPKNIVSKFAEKASYQKESTGESGTQLEMLQSLALKEKDYPHLIAHCKKRNIQFLSTPFDMDSIDFLLGLEIPFWKIPSGEITNLPYLVKLGKTGKPAILSTGMSNIDEIKSAVKVLEESGAGTISILHCNTEYPTPFQDVNLRAMLTIQHETGKDVGYSDHTLGIEVPIAAVAMGATIIEKHFTLDNTMIGPDHKASLEPDELKQMVKSIRNIEISLGDGRKEPSPSEQKNIHIIRKSIVAKKEIVKGDILTEENMTIKRPGTGISPMRWNEVVGTIANKNFSEDELIII